MKIKIIGKGKPLIGVVCCLHGNELVGRRIVRRLERARQPRRLRLKLVIANEEAIGKGKRFVESDLNRSFPGGARGTVEQRLAVEIKRQLADCKYVIDIHSTHADMEPVIITTSGTARRGAVSDLIGMIPLHKVLIMPKSVSRTGALIEHTRAGVSVEFNRRLPTRDAYGTVEKAIHNIARGNRQTRKEFFKVTGVVKGRRKEAAMLHNFVKVKAGQRIGSRKGRAVHAKSDFYPVFVGEKEYRGVICMTAQKAKVK
jgi:predicted deacylase